jgi:hypothetical protein
MKKFLSIIVMVAMVLSLVQGFAPKPVAEAASSGLQVTWLETPCMTPFNGQVPVGTLFTVKAELHSLSNYAKNVSVTIGYSGSLELLSAATVPVGDVYSDRDEIVAWNFKCTGEGDASVFISSVQVDNLTQGQVSLPDPCNFHQGPPTPPPPPQGNWTITATYPDKVCTDCAQSEFQISAYAHNGTSDVANDVYAEITIVDSDLATLKDWSTKRQYAGTGIAGNSNTNTVTWNLICLNEGPTHFKIDFYKDGTSTIGSGTLLVSKTVIVNQKNYIVSIDSITSTDSGVVIHNPTTAQDVYNVTSETCNTFEVKTTFKNCTCYPIQDVKAIIDRDGANCVSLDSDKFVHVQEWEQPVQGGTPEMKREYDIPASTVINNGYVLDLTTNCACCYFVVTWPFKCSCSDGCDFHPITFKAQDGNGNLLDSAYFGLKQQTSPKLSAGINIFPGWFSDNTLGTTEITGVASACQGGSLGANSNFTVVVPVANLGDITANGVYVKIEMTGAFTPVVAEGISGNGVVTNPLTPRDGTLDFAGGYEYFDIGTVNGLCAGNNAYKILIEGTCTGDTDLLIKVTDLGGIDSLTGSAIPAKDACGTSNIYLPSDRTLKQIPMDFELVEPDDGSSIMYSTNFAVKIRVHNCTNDDDNVVKGLTATISWTGPAEFNPGLPSNDQSVQPTQNLGDLGKNGYAETAWNMHCNGVGDVKFNITLKAADPGMTLTKTFTIHQTPETTLETTIVSPLPGCLVYANGEEFPITAKVKNTGTKDAKNVNVDLIFNSDYFEVVETPPVLHWDVLGAGEETPLLTWTLKVLKGDAPPASQTVTVEATADNANPSSDSRTVWPYPAAYLKVEVTPLTDNKVDVGSDFDFKVKVTNLGWADAYDVWAYIEFSSNVMLQPGNNDTKIYIGTLQGHGGALNSKEVTFKLQCEGAGKSQIRAYAQGKDEYGYYWGCGETDPYFYPYPGDYIRFVEDASYVFEQVIPGGPMLTITSPADGFATNSSDVKVTFEATGGTAPYTFAAKVDDAPWVSPIPGTGSYTFHNLTDGNHTLYIMVTDSNSKYYIGFVNVTIDKTAPPAPFANPVGGIYYGPQTITLSDQETDAKIYYTTDGTIPTTSSTLYTAPITIGEGITTLRAIAVDAAGNVSGVMSETYNITPHYVTSTIHLLPGWNLISVPFNVNGTGAFTNCTMFLKWNGASWDDVTSFEPGVGYLVLNTGSAEDVTLSGMPTASPFTITTNGNYQLIGDPFEVAVPWSSITNVSHIKMALYWDGSKWVQVNLSTDSMQPGVGYLIQTSDVGTLSFQRP